MVRKRFGSRVRRRIYDYRRSSYPSDQDPMVTAIPAGDDGATLLYHAICQVRKTTDLQLSHNVVQEIAFERHTIICELQVQDRLELMLFETFSKIFRREPAKVSARLKQVPQAVSRRLAPLSLV